MRFRSSIMATAKPLVFRARWAVFVVACVTASHAFGQAAREPGMGNPLLPGYYADPSIVEHEGKYYLYVTLDPWGGETLGCWDSADFKSWTYRVLNWPTRKACKSPTSGGSAVWAPSVVRGREGRFYMYVSVHNEVWAGVADHPLGPWQNALGDRPLIPKEFRPGFHMIDAEAFIDDDGSAWLYWGSGWGWKNGRCWAVKLKSDMVTFDGDVHDVTPANYFEGPVMVKRHGKYFLMYSNGVTVKDTYQVHYAVGDNPLGPFVEPANSPVLATDKGKDVVSPGHHTIFHLRGRDYILYHRHSVPFDPKFVGRQTCVDEITFNADGTVDKVAPTHEGPELVRGRLAGRKILPASASASSEAGDDTAARFAVDDNYATRWRAALGAPGGWLMLDMERVASFSRLEIRPEYAWKHYKFRVEASEDGQTWRTLADYTDSRVIGSPIVVQASAPARYVRLVAPASVKGESFSIIECSLHE
jgi:arabinoxylan arabinofuranohydrolase